MFQQVVGAQLPYDNLAEVRDRLTEVSPNLTRYGDVEEANYFAQASSLAQVKISEISYLITADIFSFRDTPLTSSVPYLECMWSPVPS